MTDVSVEEGESVARSKKEEQFARELEKLLAANLLNEYKPHVGRNLLYKLEVDVEGHLRPSTNLQEPKRGQFAFQTDLLIEKQTKGNPIPLVVVELKFGSFSTHDIITYSAKATRHKEIYPYLRYGFVVGGSKALSKKFMTHNQGVDFAMSILSVEEEGQLFVELIQRQIQSAEELVEMMRMTRTTFKCFEKNIAVKK